MKQFTFLTVPEVLLTQHLLHPVLMSERKANLSDTSIFRYLISFVNIRNQILKQLNGPQYIDMCFAVDNRWRCKGTVIHGKQVLALIREYNLKTVPLPGFASCVQFLPMNKSPHNSCQS